MPYDTYGATDDPLDQQQQPGQQPMAPPLSGGLGQTGYPDRARPPSIMDPAIAQAVADLAQRRAQREAAVQGSMEGQKWSALAQMASGTLAGLRGAFGRPLTSREAAENRAAAAGMGDKLAEGAQKYSSAPLQAQELGQKLERGDIENVKATEDLKKLMQEQGWKAQRYDPNSAASAAARGEGHAPLSLAEAEDVGKLRSETATAGHTEEETAKIQRGKQPIGEGTVANLYGKALGLDPKQIAQLSLEDMPALDRVLMHRENLDQSRKMAEMKLAEIDARRHEPDERTQQAARDVHEAYNQALDVLEQSGGHVLGAGPIMGRLEQIRNPEAQKMAAAMATLGRTVMVLRGRGGSSGGGPTQQNAALTEIGYNAPNASDDAILTNLQRALQEANNRLEYDPQATAHGRQLMDRLERIMGGKSQQPRPTPGSAPSPGASTGADHNYLYFKKKPNPIQPKGEEQ